MPNAEEAALDKKQGLECYDWYHYLWHLIAIRAVKATALPDTQNSEGKYAIEPDAWTKMPDHENTPPGSGAVVAVIDTGVEGRHPNLAGRVLPTIDFAAHPFGMRLTPPAQGAALPAPNAGLPAFAKQSKNKIRGLPTRLSDSVIPDATWLKAKAAVEGNQSQERVIARLEAGRGIEEDLAPAVSRRFPAHGTACAGLIAGAPEAAVGDDPDDGPIPYWGVAPGAKILPIVVSAEPTAEQLIMAFLYALGWEEDCQRVSVIHFPRQAPHPGKSPLNGKPYGDTRYDADANGNPATPVAWSVFEAVLSVVAEKIPVVCAAGNDGLDALTWPAAEATESNGVIAVGAVTYQARRSSYSNYAKPDDTERLTLVAPSDDAEVYTRTQVRLDAESPDWRRHNHYFDANGLGIEVPFSPQSLVTTDIPGPSGYVGGYVEGASSGRGVEDRASLYALFGGTSGASAIVAGAVALLQAQQGNTALDGPGVKAKVNGAVATVLSWPWLAGAVSLQGDAMNGENVDATLGSRQFGKGVLDLDKLLS